MSRRPTSSASPDLDHKQTSAPIEQREGIPLHVAIIMDGNGRWANHKGFPRLAGHRAGLDNIRPVLEALSGYNVEYVTIYAFSTENWNRPEQEVEGLMALLREAIDKETESLHERGVRILI